MREPLQMLRLADVCRLTGKTSSAIHRDRHEGLFPPPVKIGLRASAWAAHEVEKINAARLAGKSDEYIRDLVKQLTLDRAALGETASTTQRAA